MSEAPVTIVIFGGAGDLAHRKLLPALYNLHIDGALPSPIAVVGVGRTPLTNEGYRDFAKAGVKAFSRRPIDEATWAVFGASLFFVPVPAETEEGLAPLVTRLDIIERERGLPGNRIYYLALPPALFVPTVQQLDRAGLIPSSHPAGGGAGAGGPYARLIVEKPIGRDLPSALAINDAIGRVFDEGQIFRIDHYLGKETVQNLLVLRFANSIFEPLFNQKYVDHVQITVAETEGVGTRAGYYDRAGALRDMVQNHLLQLLALVGLEPPHVLDAEVIRDEKLELLQSLRPWAIADVDANSVRAQYGSGASADGTAVPGYLEEPGVAGQSRTETFVALRTYIDNWRWAGVPFFLRTGKRMAARASAISVYLKDVPPILFNTEASARLAPNVLTIRIQPDEGFSLAINSKRPGAQVHVEPVNMDFHYAAGASPEAYERLLVDVMAGDTTLFMRRDVVEAAWRWVMPILDRWASQTTDLLPTYSAGTWGPAEAERLMADSGRRWHALL